MYLATRKELKLIANKSRADYFRKRRKNTKAFYVEVDCEKMQAFEEHLCQNNTTKKKWLNEKIDEELK